MMPWIFAAVFVVVTLIILGTLSLRWLGEGRRIGGGERRCAACGYIVEGLPTAVCPECRADLKQPGAVLAPGRLRPTRLSRSIGWSIFCVLAVVLPFGLAWWVLVMPSLPRVLDDRNVVTLSQPASNAYQSIQLLTHAHCRLVESGMSWRLDALEIELTVSGQPVRTLLVDPATLHFREISRAMTCESSAPLDEQALLSWLARNKIAANTNQLKEEMAYVIAEVHRMANPSQDALGNSHFTLLGGPPFSSTGITGGLSVHQLPWVGWTPLFVGGLVWAIGMLRIANRP